MFTDVTVIGVGKPVWRYCTIEVCKLEAGGSFPCFLVLGWLGGGPLAPPVAKVCPD